MALTPFIQDGHMTFFSDLVLAITVHDIHNLSFQSFLQANHSRLHADPALADWKPPGPAHRYRARTSREHPLPPSAGTVLLSFPRPPTDPRSSAFVIGSDPRTCDIVLDGPCVSAQHVRIGFAHDAGGIIVQDVSEHGTGLLENGRDQLWEPPTTAGRAGGRRPSTPPRSPGPKTEMLVPGGIYDLEVPGFRMQFQVPVRHGHEGEVYERKRRAFIAARGITADWSWERS
jgi:hypothetical protein